jgi:hypothetical protein
MCHVSASTFAMRIRATQLGAVDHGAEMCNLGAVPTPGSKDEFTSPRGINVNFL